MNCARAIPRETIGIGMVVGGVSHTAHLFREGMVRHDFGQAKVGELH